MMALLKNELDPDSQDSDRRTPLSYTAMNGHEAVARMLLATGQVNHSSEYSLGRTPLSWAAKDGHEVVVRLLAEGQVNPEL